MIPINCTPNLWSGYYEPHDRVKKTGQRVWLRGILESLWSYLHFRHCRLEVVYVRFRGKQDWGVGGPWWGCLSSPCPSPDSLFLPAKCTLPLFPVTLMEQKMYTSGAALQLCLLALSCRVLQSLGLMSSSFSLASWSMISGSRGTYVSYYCMEFSMYFVKLF